MINKIQNIAYKKINRISPSQFHSMTNCAYKFLLAEAFDHKPLLPVSPNAIFGTVLHKILELIEKKIIKDDNDFEIEFNKQVKLLEDDLKSKGLSFLIPLKIKLKNFGLKKIQLKKHLRIESGSSMISTQIKYHSEKWLESLDKLIGGKVDLIIENGDYVEIIDFKTGAITENFFDDIGEIVSDVKHEYKEQLKLYAYLFFENTKKFPTKISLVNLAKVKVSVDFSKEDCKVIFDDAKNLLKITNDCIITNSFSAVPSDKKCKYCLYRPACSFFNEQLEDDFSFSDVFGEIIDVKKFKNGNVSVYLQNGDNIVTIKNLYSNYFEELYRNKNKKIRIYNIRKESVNFVYSAGDTTMIYE
jgi:CRISPR/Cas system-associated exonuclease Cas4 (RecB family)